MEDVGEQPSTNRCHVGDAPVIVVDSIVGKRVLVDVVEYDRNLHVRLSVNCTGVIVRVDRPTHERAPGRSRTVHIRRDDTGEIVLLRASAESFEITTGDSYKLKDGNSATSIDLLACWTWYDELRGHAKV